MYLRIILNCVLVLFLVQGCAYFNTFYNTKKLYKEAQEDYKRRRTDKPSSSEIQNLDKTIEKASKMLQLYPDSKYVDDSLLILGECFYYKQEYLKAIRKFDELTTLFPKSSLVSKAQLWKARSYIELEDFANAEQVLKDLQRNKQKGEIFHEAQYRLGEIYFRKENYAEAAALYAESADKLDDKKTKAEVYMRLGESLFNLGRYQEAGKAYEDASKQNIDIDKKFDATLEYTRCLKADQKYDEAMSRLNKMLSEFALHQDLAWVKYEIADCHLLQGEDEEAEEQFLTVTEEHKRSEGSAASQFALGNLYMNRDHDYVKAKEHYDKVRTESAISEYIELAQEQSEAIEQYKNLKNSFALLELQRASLEAGKSGAQAQQEIAGTARSTQGKRASIRRLPTKKLEFSDNPEKLDQEIASSKIALAELYHDRLGAPDSAIYVYQDVIENFGHTEAAARAMYALAFMMEEREPALADSLLEVLATEHQTTPHGIAARRRLGLPVSETQVTQDKTNKFVQAENLWLSQGKAEEAVDLYQEFIQEEPESDLSPKSLYAIGWIYENELVNNEQAYSTYKQLVEKFPASPYARQVGNKIRSYEQYLAQAEESEKPGTTETDADSVPALAGGQEETDDLRSRISEDREQVLGVLQAELQEEQAAKQDRTAKESEERVDLRHSRRKTGYRTALLRDLEKQNSETNGGNSGSRNPPD